jgi:hypothetical protein
MPDKTIGDVLSDLVEDQLGNERALKESLATRSAVIISSAGTLVTLLLGGIALIEHQASARVSRAITPYVAFAMAVLVLSSLIALVVNSPWRQTALSMDTLQDRYLVSEWESLDSEFVEQAYKLRLDFIKQLRTGNQVRSWCLTVALGLECLALVFLAVVTEIVLSLAK